MEKKKEKKNKQIRFQIHVSLVKSDYANSFYSEQNFNMYGFPPKMSLQSNELIK